MSTMCGFYRPAGNVTQCKFVAKYFNKYFSFDTIKQVNV